MKQGVLSANPSEWLTFRPPHAPTHLVERNGFRAHGVQTRNQKSRAETLAIDLAVYLVGRLVDSQVFEHSRKLFVPDATPHHLNFYQLLRGLLPGLVRLSLPNALALRCIHYAPLAFERPLLISCRHSPTTIFGRIRLICARRQYTFSASYFLRTKMLRMTPTALTGNQMPNSGGPK